MTPTADGLDLHVVGMEPVSFAAIRAVSVGQAPSGIEIVLVIEGQSRAFHATPLQVAFPDFPFPHRPVVAMNLRGLLFHLLKHCPALVLDEATASFLEGQGVPRITQLAEHAARLIAATETTPQE